MCLARAYLGDQKEFLMEDIASLTIDNGKINLRNLFGEQKEIEGIVRKVDFQNASIMIQAADK